MVTGSMQNKPAHHSMHFRIQDMLNAFILLGVYSIHDDLMFWKLEIKFLMHKSLPYLSLHC